MKSLFKVIRWSHSVNVYLLWFKAMAMQFDNSVHLSHIQSIRSSLSSLAFRPVFFPKTSNIPVVVGYCLSIVCRILLSIQWCFISSACCCLKLSAEIILKSCYKHNIFVCGSVMALRSSSAMLKFSDAILSSASWFFLPISPGNYHDRPI